MINSKSIQEWEGKMKIKKIKKYRVFPMAPWHLYIHKP